MFKKSVAIVLAFFLMWGNTGFCLNVHYCSTSEVVSVMINHLIGERCGTEASHEEPEVCDLETKSCCTLLESKAQADKDDCCSDTELEVHIQDAFHISNPRFEIQDQLSWINIFFPDVVFLHSSQVSYSVDVYRPKPPETPDFALYSGQDRLHLHCIYRI